MDDERVVGAELNRLAATDPLDPIDPAAMLTRGRRSRRTRRLLGAGGVVSAVAAVAVGASLLPGSAVPTPEPNVAGPSKKTSVSSDFTAVPGVPRGEAAIGVQLSYQEVNRRCALRNPTFKRQIQAVGNNLRPGITVEYKLKLGDHVTTCTIPAGDKPSAALIEAARKDPIPKTTADQLRNCSVHFWSDLTQWKVLASDIQPGLAASLVAQSPSGKSIVNCIIAVTPYDGPQLDASSRLMRTAEAGRNTFATAFDSIPGGQQGCANGNCKGWLYNSVGRVPSNIAKIRVEPVGGGSHDLTLEDGWFAMAWLSPDRKGRPDAKVTAYDQAGKVLQVVGG